MWKYTGLTRYQGVLSVIGIIVVAAALIGGGVWVQHRGEVARENAAQVATTQGSTGAGTTKNAASTSKTTAPSANHSSTGTATSGSGSSAGSSAQSSNSAASSSSSSGTAANSSNLPETGPANVAMTALVLSLLTFVVLSYVNSRRLQTRL